MPLFFPALVTMPAPGLVLSLEVSRLQGCSERGRDPTPLPRRVQLPPRPPRPAAARGARRPRGSCISGAQVRGSSATEAGRSPAVPAPAQLGVGGQHPSGSRPVHAVSRHGRRAAPVAAVDAAAAAAAAARYARGAVGSGGRAGGGLRPGVACARLQPWPRLSTRLRSPAP